MRWLNNWAPTAIPGNLAYADGLVATCVKLSSRQFTKVHCERLSQPRSLSLRHHLRCHVLYTTTWIDDKRGNSLFGKRHSLLQERVLSMTCLDEHNIEACCNGRLQRATEASNLQEKDYKCMCCLFPRLYRPLLSYEGTDMVQLYL